MGCSNGKGLIYLREALSKIHPKAVAHPRKTCSPVQLSHKSGTLISPALLQPTAHQLITVWYSSAMGIDRQMALYPLFDRRTDPRLISGSINFEFDAVVCKVKSMCRNVSTVPTSLAVDPGTKRQESLDCLALHSDHFVSVSIRDGYREFRLP